MEFFWSDLVGTMIQALEGIGVWAVEAVIILGVLFLIYKLVKKAPAWGKAVALVVVLGLFAVLNWEVVDKTRDLELSSRPDQITFDQMPVSEIKKGSMESGMNVGWIHCGDFDSFTHRWPKRYLTVSGQSNRTIPENLVGQTGRSPIALSMFDSPPKFSVVYLKWDFGGFESTLEPYEEVKILEVRNLGNNRIWCKVERIGME